MNAALFVGIDVGSSATKCVVLDNAGAIVGHHVLSSGFDFAESAQESLDRALLVAKGTLQDISYCVSTGYGREHVTDADRRVTEITCHARGAREWCPDVRHIIDIGGQDTKVIHIDAGGGMADFRMNGKCAAGTGTFLESIAVMLGVTLREIDDLAMTSSAGTIVNSFCTVFAGTEVIERIKAGEPRQDISMGLFRSIATRIMEMMSSRNGPVGVTGGVVAHCRAMVRALGEVLETEILLPPMPQHAGAYGAALLAAESCAATETPWEDRLS